MKVKNIFCCPKIHSPSTNYFSSVYMTLLSVFQCIILAYLLQPFSVEFLKALNDKQPLPLLPFMPPILFAVLLWHNYISHHQIVVWQINKMDTIIIVIFGLIESFMILGITNNDFIVLQFSIAVGILWGSIAYLYAYNKINKDYIQEIFKEYYSCPKKTCNLADKLRQKMIDFEFNAFYKLLLDGIILLLFAFLLKLYKGDITIGYLVFFASTFLIYSILHDLDIKNDLNEIQFSCNIAEDNVKDNTILKANNEI